MSDVPDNTEVQCESCSAQLTIDTGQRTMRCPFCDAPSVISFPSTPGRPDPVFALGFSLNREDAASRVREWIATRKLTPFGLEGQAAERVTGVYVPTYLYSATARSRYQADIAEYYGSRKLKRSSEERIPLSPTELDEVEHRDLQGNHVAYVVDLVVTASRGISNQELQAIEPFDLQTLRRFSPELIAGWQTEEPSLSPEDCVRLGQREGSGAIARALQEFMPGDGFRKLRHQTTFEEECIALTLVPVWVFAFRYHPKKPPVRILVNGQTGKVNGTIPFSWGKAGLIAGVLVLVIVVLAVIGSLAGSAL